MASHVFVLLFFSCFCLLFFASVEASQNNSSLCGSPCICTYNATSCYNLHVSDVGSQSFNFSNRLNVVVIDLNANFLRSEHLSFLNASSFPVLRELHIKKNRLTIIPSKAFSGLPSLIVLELGFNLISQLHVDAFVGLKSLFRIGLQANFLTKISPGTFDPLFRLNNLDLRANLLTTLTTGIIPMASPFLSNTQLEGNAIQNVEDFAFANPHLQYVNLGTNALSKISSNAFAGADSLLSITLSVNAFTEFADDAFRNLSQLNRVYFATSRLISYPSSLLVARSLQYIFMPLNLISSMPPNFMSYYPSLILLAMDNSIIDCEIDGLRNLACQCKAPFTLIAPTTCAQVCSASTLGPSWNLSCPYAYANSSSCTAKCKYSPTLTGKLTCNSSSRWEVLGSSVSKTFSSHWNNTLDSFLRLCQVVDCGPLHDQISLNDSFVASCSSTFSNGSGCAVSCLHPSEDDLNVVLRCSVLGKWEGGLPQCVSVSPTLPPASSSSSSQTNAIIITLVIAIFALGLIVVVIFVVYRRYNKRRLGPTTQRSVTRASNVQRVDVLLNSPYVERVLSTDYVHIFRDPSLEKSRFLKLEMPASNLEIIGQLGEGNYGLVKKGCLIDCGQTVAVKSVKPDAHLEEQQKIILEAMLMGKLSHPHIVSLVGICSAVNPFLIITEFMAGGSLLDFLESMSARHLSSHHHHNNNNNNNNNNNMIHADDVSIFVEVLQQVADAMKFLEGERIVHRDLAARNILVGEDYHHIKLSDFGMARVILESDYYRQESQDAVPVKWLAPESIRFKLYTSSSDAWSFGMVMYEVTSYGRPPFEHLSPLDAAKRIFANHLLEQPSTCPDELYELMVQCWSPSTSDRPTFAMLYGALSRLMTTSWKHVQRGVPDEEEMSSL